MDVSAARLDLRRLADARGFAWTELETGGRVSLPLLQRASGTRHAPRVYLSAGIHGDEPAGPAAIVALLDQDLLGAGCDWTLLPLLNPEGLARQTRENADGLDLNRDYLRLSSPEVRAHRRWLATSGAFDLAVCLHEDWESRGFYLYENPSEETHQAMDAVGPRLIAALEADGYPIENAVEIDGFPACHGVIFPHEGTADGRPDALAEDENPEALHLWQHHHAHLFTLETPSSLPLDGRVAMHVAAVRWLTAWVQRDYKRG